MLGMDKKLDRVGIFMNIDFTKNKSFETDKTLREIILVVDMWLITFNCASWAVVHNNS